MHIVVDRFATGNWGGLGGGRWDGRIARTRTSPSSPRRSFGIFIEPLNQRRCQIPARAGIPNCRWEILINPRLLLIGSPRGEMKCLRDLGCGEISVFPRCSYRLHSAPVGNSRLVWCLESVNVGCLCTNVALRGGCFNSSCLNHLHQHVSPYLRGNNCRISAQQSEVISFFFGGEFRKRVPLNTVGTKNEVITDVCTFELHSYPFS